LEFANKCQALPQPYRARPTANTVGVMTAGFILHPQVTTQQHHLACH